MLIYNILFEIDYCSKIAQTPNYRPRSNIHVRNVESLGDSYIIKIIYNRIGKTPILDLNIFSLPQYMVLFSGQIIGFNIESLEIFEEEAQLGILSKKGTDALLTNIRQYLPTSSENAF